MWARRCGAPERWPSRVKVIIFSIFDGTIGLSIYKYMAGSNISYLDLGKPASAEVQCLTNWPKSGHAISWSEPMTFFSWWTSAADLEDALANSQHCEVPGTPHQACARILAPIKDMKNPLALAMTGDDITRMDILGMSARFFLVVTIFIWIGVVTHDLALVGRSNKDFILDVSGVNQHVPVIRRVWRCLAGYRPLFRILRYQGAGVRLLGMALAVFVVPGLIIWNLAVFNFVIVPLLLLAFFRYPIRMSRAWVFVVCLACSIYGLVLLTLQVAYLYLPEWRPRYAVTWKKADCTCGCDYPISLGVNANLAVIGAATTMKSFFVAFRCLKGLRRSQWANLLSVVFPVPITVYAVDWRQNGQPVKGRTEKIAVQEEVAFDPFALMDEQLDSSSTTLHLRPEPINAYRSSDGKRLVPMRYARTVEMPAKPNLETAVQLTDMEYIGCCGFPWPTGGKKGIYSPEFIALVFEKTIEVQQPRAAGAPGMKLVPREAPQPSAHEPAVEELEL